MTTMPFENELSTRLDAHDNPPANEVTLHPRRLIRIPVSGPVKKIIAIPKEPTQAGEQQQQKQQ